MVVFWLIAACATSPAPQAGDVAYGDATVAAALARLEEAEKHRQEREDQVGPLATVQRVSTLEDRVASLELEVSRINTEAATTAGNVSFDPGSTTLAARDLQAAVVELQADIDSLRDHSQTMGAPGPGLFDTERGPLGPRVSPSEVAAGQRGAKPGGGKPGTAGGGGPGGAVPGR